MSIHGNYTKEKVTFDSHGDLIVGDVYKPSSAGPFPTIIILGPYSFQKEQAPTQYATRLADEGYLTLVFDPRTVGESSGLPRRLENPKMKNEDVISAIQYALTLTDVNPNQIYLLGICQGGPQMLDIASYEDKVKAVASITGYYRDHETDLFMIAAGVTENPFDTTQTPSISELETLYVKRIQRAKEAKTLHENTGEVIYHPLVSPELGDRVNGALVGLPGPLVWSWYGAWTMKGWENRYAIMSDLDHFAYSTVSGIAKLNKPALIVHSDMCMNPASARRHYDSIPTHDKKLIWENDTHHFQYYEQPDIVDRTVGYISNWFKSHTQ